MLTANGASLLAFLNVLDPLWAETQTVPPDDIQATAATANGIGLEWPAIAYTADSGHYEISYATTPGGPYTLHGVTASKAVTHYWADGLTPGTPYYFVVRSVTLVHGDQQSVLISGYGPEMDTATPSAGALLIRRHR